MAWVTKDSVEQYDHTPEPPKEYTKKEKAQNWWHYHKFIVLGVVVAILVVGVVHQGYRLPDPAGCADRLHRPVRPAR